MAAMVIAHRGNGGVRLPENSIAAFENAIRVGADMVEFDVRRLLDGTLVVHHDASFRGVPLEQLTLERIAGRRGAPPTLAEAVRCCAGRIGMNVELKEPGYEDRVVDAVLDRVSVADVIFSSFHDGAVAAIKRHRPGARCGLLLGMPRAHARAQVAELFPWGRVQRCGADLVIANQRIATGVFLRSAARHRVPVMLWTVNRERTLREALADARITGVITDTPVRALALRDGGSAELA